MTKVMAPPATARIAIWLGYAGLIPFLAVALLTWTDPERAVLWHGILLDYGAVILSFVGAIYWGVAMAPGDIDVIQRNTMFAWSVVPSLLAFLALILHSVFGDILLVGGFLLHFGIDSRFASRVVLPQWFLPLRLRLSVVAIICLAAGALARGH